MKGLHDGAGALHVAFLDEALKEWRKRDSVTREPFKAKLAERLQNPKIPSARLQGAKARYKIKPGSAPAIASCIGSRTRR